MTKLYAHGAGIRACTYLTEGKLYEAVLLESCIGTYSIKNDDGVETVLYAAESSHIDNEAFIVIDNERFTQGVSIDA